MLAYLGVRNRQVVEDLVQAAKASKSRRQWWDEQRFRDHLTAAVRQLIQYEAEASEARHFCVGLIPGRLQTDAYARQLLSHYADELGPEAVAVRLEARARRRDQLLSRRDRPRIYLLLDESVLLRQIGGRQIMGEQLSALSTYADEGWLTVRIAPFNKPAPTVAPYELLYLGADDAQHAIMYRKSELQDELVDDKASTTRHRLIWDRFWFSSIEEETSAHLLHSRGEWFLGEDGDNPVDSGPRV